MKYIDSPWNDAFYNMALEEYVFESLPRDQQYFMLWQNKNAVVVGKYQNTLAEINRDYVTRQDISVVRRLSGGGAMYQDLGNLNFTFVVDQSGAKNLDFRLFMLPVIEALAKIGIRAEQNSRNDITIDGKKFSGNAQYNKQGRTMHHGTLLFDSRLETLGQVLTPSLDKMQSKGVKSVKSRVTNIAPYLTAPMTMQQFKDLLVQEIFQLNPVEPYVLTRQDLEGIEALRESKYATWEWNWGTSPACTVEKKRRFDFGSVCLQLDVDKSQVRQAHITGDFFGNGDISRLEQALVGCRLEQTQLAQALQDIDIEEYIAGMHQDVLIDMLLN